MTGNRRDYDDKTQEAMDVEFLPWFQSTFGLTRPNSPIDDIHRQRYHTVLNESIKETMLSRLTHESIERITTAVNRPDLINRLSNSVRRFKGDVERHYIWAMKKAIMDYVLKDEDEQKRLGIKMISKVLLKTRVLRKIFFGFEFENFRRPFQPVDSISHGMRI